ncbi:MAG: phosphoribosyltransferase family protein [Desulfovibrionaceae bacterium]
MTRTDMMRTDMMRTRSWAGIAPAVLDALAAWGIWRARCRACGAPFDPGAGPHGRPLGLDRMLCPACAPHLAVRTGGFCPRCGQMYALDHEPPRLCGTCQATPPPWERLVFHGPYDGLLRQLLLDFKFHARLGVGGLLRAMAVEALIARDGGGPEGACHGCSDMPPRIPPERAVRYDLVAPIPLHATRLVWRGYNQSLELARLAARWSRATLDHRVMVRRRATRPQAELGRHEREANLKGAFGVDKARVAGRTILLVDDIMTTGATLREASRSLLAAGAARVDVLVLARTPQA